MTHSRAISSALLGGMLAVFGACSDSSKVAGPSRTSPQEHQSRTVESTRLGQRPLDDAFGRIDEHVPGFGGFFFDEQGNLVAYLVDPKKHGQLRAELQRMFKDDRRISKAKLRVRQGRYGFRDLREMYGRISANIERTGLVFTDIDEARNRLRFGVIDVATRARLEAEVAGLAVPKDAFVVELTAPVRRAATLRDQVLPVMGGLKITAQSSGIVCNLGFHAIQGGLNYYVTNSHCTDVQGGVENTQFYQPAEFNPGGYTYLGYEYADPYYSSGGTCPTGRLCRNSDAALIAKTDNHLSRFGSLARTTYKDPFNGSIIIDPAYPNGFQLVGEKAYPVSGEILNKVGQQTGWTYGFVAGTCVDYDDGTSNATFFCQDEVDAGSDEGDSGSPVFGLDPQLSNGYLLYGILWGSVGGSRFVFSAMDQIESELGGLHTS